MTRISNPTSHRGASRLVRGALSTLLAFCALAGWASTASAQDGDGDGVLDASDICPTTPLGYTVDGAGCDAYCEVADLTTDVFLRSRLLEVGTASEASFGSSIVPPAGWHARAPGGLLGFVANPQADDWTNYNGDFFVPGTPEEGFGLSVGGTNYFNSTLMGMSGIPGDFTGTRVECEPVVCGLRGGGSVYWSGAVAGIDVDHTYSVLNEGLFILIEVTLTNTTGSAQTVTYFRNVDPDNQQTLTGSYTTINTVQNQGDGTATSVALVTAETAAVAGVADASYIALISSDPDARVTHGGFSNRDADAVWNCTGGLTCAEGAIDVDDIAISLAIRKTIPAGGTVSFAYAYTLDPVDVLTSVGCTEPAVCGDGIIEGVESCDDGATVAGDGCSDTCSVEPGYTCVGEPSVCTDIDECTLGTDDCDTNATCANTPGSFTCTCNAGYSGDGRTCADDDECALGTDDCDTNATCTNTPGSFTCACDAGYSGDGRTCTDDDECALGTDDCDANATCANTPGSFTCTCDAGYSGDGRSCTDDDECVLGTDDCDTNATCANTPGSFTCTCDAGYSGDGRSCTDDDECVLGTDDCDTNATCTNTPGSFSCACNPGYSGDGRTCADDDECALGTDDCDTNATCANTPGSFLCTCNPGYTGDGVVCTDDDECVAGTDDCHADAICTNTAGGFTCACGPGFTGDGVTSCEPICGDGMVVGGEECDDNNTDVGDGCDDSCAIEAGFVCDEEPSICGICIDTEAAAATDLGCTDAAPICVGSGATAFCAPCINDTDGRADLGCEAEAPACDVSATPVHVCIDCEDTEPDAGIDNGCTAETPVCGTDAADAPQCFECTSHDHCPAGTFCGPAGSCVPGCLDDDDCIPTPETPLCETTLEICVECLVDDDCLGTEICDDTNSCSPADSDGDGVPDDADLDDDNDGIPDDSEIDASLLLDSNSNGIIDFEDADVVDCPDVAPADGICDELPEEVDFDGDGFANHLDLDADGDGIVDLVEGGGLDLDGDGTVDEPLDANGDGLHDEYAAAPLPLPDSDSDGAQDFLDADSDGDGVADAIEGHDANHDGVADVTPGGTDSDGDGLDDAFDPTLDGTTAPLPDTDGDGLPDFQDGDDDGDSIDSIYEGAPDQDTDGDGTPDYLDPDDDGDETPTIEEGPDPNGDGNPDDANDSDDDGIPDYLDDRDGTSSGPGGLAGGACGCHAASPTGNSAGVLIALSGILLGLLVWRRRERH